MNAEVLVYIFVLLLVSMPLFFVGLLIPIGDWLDAREKRKKAAANAAAKAAAKAAESTVAESGAASAGSA